MHKVIKSIYKNSKPIELLIITGRVGHTPRVLCRYEIILQWLNRYNPPEVLWEQCLPSSTALQVLWSTQLLFKSQITYKCVPGGGDQSGYVPRLPYSIHNKHNKRPYRGQRMKRDHTRSTIDNQNKITQMLYETHQFKINPVIKRNTSNIPHIQRAFSPKSGSISDGNNQKA